MSGCLTVYNDATDIGPPGPPGPIGPAGPPGPGLSNEIVQLPDNLTTRVPIISMNNTGVYKILVEPQAILGAHATFDCSKTQDIIPGQTERLTNSPASTVERLKLDWLAGGPPTLYHSPVRTGGVGALISYKVTYMKVF